MGLGNIWRFPYLCYRNGGAVFLIPYLLMVLLIGIPMTLLEISLGQFSSRSATAIWVISPLFEGIGHGMVIICAVVSIYYNIIIAWALYYLIRSFATTLPWSTCNNEWNTPLCTLHSIENTPMTHNMTYLGSTNVTELLYKSTAYNSSDPKILGTLFNDTMGNASMDRTTPSEEFWQREVLNLSEGIHDLSGIQWHLLGCLAFTWLVVFFCVIKGIKSSGRVVYVTALLPYLVSSHVCFSPP